MENELYDQIKETIQEIRKKVNYNNFELNYPDKERPTTTFYYPDGTSNFPYYLDINENEKKDKSVNGNYSFRGYVVHCKNLIINRKNEYTNDIQIEFWEKSSNVDNKTNYYITVNYKFDKNFIKQQSSLFMGWFVSQFNHTFETVGYFTKTSLRMDYSSKYNELSVSSRFNIDDIPSEPNSYELEQLKMQIREYITISTLRFLYTETYGWTYECSNHFCDEIYSSIIGMEELWDDIIKSKVKKWNATDDSSKEYSETTIKEAVGKLQQEFVDDWNDCDWLEEYKSSAESALMDIIAGN